MTQKVTTFPFCIKIEEVGYHDHMKLAMKLYNYFLKEKIPFNCIYTGADSMMIMLYRQVEYDRVIKEFDLKKLEVFFNDRKPTSSKKID